MKKGLFIAFEGIDYSGKSLQAVKTVEWLKGLGYSVESSSEPNDDGPNSSPLGRAIRKMIDGKMERPDDPFELQRTYVLDRGQDIFCFIKPALRENKIYVMVRYAFSTITYGMLSGEQPEKFIKLHEDVLGPSLIWPDTTLLIDIPAKKAMERLRIAKNNPQFFEKEEKLKKIRQNYLELAEHPESKEKFVVIDGDQTEDKVFDDIKKTILPKLPSLIK